MKAKTLVPALLCLSISIPLAAQTADFPVPRTEWGQPDLQGVWNFASPVPLERPAAFADRAFLTDQEIAAIVTQRERGLQALNDSGANGYNTFWLEMGNHGDKRTSLITYPENGRLPALVEGADRVNGGLGEDVIGSRPVRFIVGGIGKDGPEDRGLSERCLVGFNAGPPFIPNLYNNNVQIVQGRNTAVIMTEMIHDARIVPIVDRPADRLALPDNIRLWSGDSRGWYEGDTLVVVTSHFNGLTKSFEGRGSSENKTLTERFTRTDPYTVEYEFTLEDPGTFRDKFTAMIPMVKVDGLMYEYACHEGNYGLRNTLRGARAAEQR